MYSYNQRKYHYRCSGRTSNIYQELAKIGGYFYQIKKDSKLHLIVIDKPRLSNIDDFAVPEVQRQLLLYLFGPGNLQPTLSQTELLLHQLPVIQYRGKKSCSYLSEV